LFLDGAMGTMIQKHKLEEEDFRGERFKDHQGDLKGNNDLLSITQPEIIKEIHGKFLAAGSDIIETNTFSSTKIAQADYNLEDLVYDLNFESAKIAKEVADKFTSENPDKPRFVAGAIGPTNVTLSLSPDVNDPGYRRATFADLRDAYKEQLIALIDGGVDIILIETIFDTLNAKAAIMATNEVFDEKNVQLPVMISGTIVDASGRTLSGQNIEAFYVSISHAPNLLSVGLNCALGSDQMRPHLTDLSAIADVNTSLYPNAGFPNEFGEYDETPEFMAEVISGYANEGMVNIVGGCCGTTPDHIAKIYEVVKQYDPRSIKENELT
jgi:5-methyltetrahydrofolate--homocysteine methyltransferase